MTMTRPWLWPDVLRVILIVCGMCLSSSKSIAEHNFPIQASKDERLPFTGNGTFGTRTLMDGVVIDMPPSTGCQGDRCQVQVTVEAPWPPSSLSATYPVVIFSPGFMTASDRYKSYTERLTSWGYVAVRWEPLNEYLPVFVNSHSTLAKIVHALIDWVEHRASEKGSALYGLVDLSHGVSLVGHSRGAKANSLLAAWNRTAIPAVVNLDPVDISGFDASDDQVLSILHRASAAFLNVGSQLGPESFAGSACAPKSQGYREFYARTHSPAWMVEVLHAGHMQFLDGAPAGCISCKILRALCVEGPLPDWVVRQVSQTAMVAWLKHVLEGASLEAYQGTWARYLDAAGVALSESK